MEEILVRLARKLEQKRYGKFRGVVTDNEDPDHLGRLKLRVPSVLGDQETDWALPCVPFGGGEGYGSFLLPDVDAQVWVEFEEGDIQRPIWTGTFWLQKDHVPEEARQTEPTTRLLKTPSGHLIQFDDASGEECFRLYHPAEAEVVIDKNGGITLTDAQGSKITLDAQNSEIVIADVNGNTLTLSASGTTVEDVNGNKLEMAASGTTVEDVNGNKLEMTASGVKLTAQKGSQVMLAGEGGEPLIKGRSFLTLFASHVHPGPGGSSGPPIPQGEMSTLSNKVQTS